MKSEKTVDNIDHYEMIDLVFNSGIADAIKSTNLDSLSESLWKLFLSASSRKPNPSEDFVYSRVSKLRSLIQGAWYFIQHQQNMLYRDESTGRKWIPNPYRCLEAYRSKDDKQLNHKFSHLKGSFSSLCEDEVRNPLLFFERFFETYDLEHWLSILVYWEEYALASETIFENSSMEPARDYECFQKLIEAGYLIYHWSQANSIFAAPNAHLFELCSFDVGTYDDHNPLEAINWLFYFYDIEEIREDIRTLFLPCCAEQKELKLKPDQLIDVLFELYCYGWLLLQTDYYPENWLTPDCYYYFYYPIIEQELANWSSAYLSYEESMDLQETLSIEYASSNVRSQVSVFYSLVINHLTKGHLVCTHEDYKAVKEQMLRVLDILFLINLDLCKKRVKVENRVYPNVNDRK